MTTEKALSALSALSLPETVGESVAYLYTLEYGSAVANRMVSIEKLNYPFGVCGADYLAKNDKGVSYVRQTPLYAAPPSQPAQGEPVAWVECDGELVWQNKAAAIGRNLYTRPSVPAGMKLVPVEPTDAMLSVWLSETERSGGVSGGNTVPWMRAIRRYRAMLAAAPAAPTNGEGA